MDKIVKAERAVKKSMLVVRLKDKKQKNWIRKKSQRRMSKCSHIKIKLYRGEIPQYSNGVH